MIEIKCPEAPILAESLNRSLSNLNRVNKLIDNFKTTENQDILRLSIVYIHATLEDLMRNLIFYKLQLLDNDTFLSDIPLLGESYRKDRINLVELIKYKSLTVQDLLIRSCQEYVNRLTFNNTNDIAKWFTKFKLDINKVEGSFFKIEELLRRRHKIVHDSDLSTDRIIMNDLQKSLHNGNNTMQEEIDLEFVEDKIKTLYSFSLNCIKAFLSPQIAVTMQNL